MSTENYLNDLKFCVAQFLLKTGISEPDVLFEHSAKLQYGDISTGVAMKYAKTVNLEPYVFAQLLSGHILKEEKKYISRIEVIRPGFINIFFSETFYRQTIQNILENGNNFGKNTNLNGQKWVIEHTSPNPNKAMHLGHLRNNLVGMGLVRLLPWSGAKVISEAVDNNRGIAIAKLMWGFLSHMRRDEMIRISLELWIQHPERWYSPQECSMLPDIFVTKCYVLGERDFKKSKEIENKIRDLVVKWESNDEYTWKLWSHVLSYAYDGMNRTLSRLGNHWDVVWHEHEHYTKGKNYVKKGLGMGIFTRLDDGAILTDLKKYDIPDTILLKNDGTSLYITQDIALTALKKEKYHAQKLVWVIGPEQSMAMKQLFAVCEQLGIGARDTFTHVTYGYVGLKDNNGGFKKMSSREGTVVLIDDVIDTVKKKIEARFMVEDKNKEMTQNMETLTEKMAVAAVKFSILKSDRNQDLVFSVEKSIETTGDSGIYVLYAYVRTQSVIRKSYTKEIMSIIFPEIIGDERNLVNLLAFFPEIIKRSTDDLSVHHIAQYLLELSSVFNGWYSKEIILDNSKYQPYKVAITRSVGSVIKSGLQILGIDTVEQI